MIDPSGILIIDKPADWTSHDVVAKTRGILGTKKVGHAGTLDPLATGVLILGVGDGTKILRYLVGHDKVYEAQIRLGAVSDTYDIEGEVVENELQNFTPPTENQISELLAAQFTGKIEQVPPAFSALKIAGKPAHRLARAGKKVAMKPRPTEIFAIDILQYDFPILHLKIHCGSGTYIRSLVHDLGRALGCGAILQKLIRIRSGHFDLSAAVPLADLTAQNLLPLQNALPNWPHITLSAADFTKIKVGRRIANPERLPHALAFHAGALVSILKGAGDEWQVERNLI